MDIYLEVVEPAFWNSKIFEIRVTLMYIATRHARLVAREAGFLVYNEAKKLTG